jgi:hypothetical protein
MKGGCTARYSYSIFDAYKLRNGIFELLDLWPLCQLSAAKDPDNSLDIVPIDVMLAIRYHSSITSLFSKPDN